MRRVGMRKIREVLRLAWTCGLSQREVAQACGMSRSTVHDYLRRAGESGLAWDEVGSLDDGALEARLYQPSVRPKLDRAPDWDAFEKELKKRGTTRLVLWEEYREQRPDGWSYTRFCYHYRQWLKTQDPTLRLNHKAGEELQVDFAGQTMPVTDRLTGEVQQVPIFVATLPASAYLYCQACPDQSLPSWLAAHVRTFETLGGVPAIVRPDNLKAAVTKPCRYEPELNPAYAEMADHYGVAVVPARVAKPRDKASVESHVRLVEQQILARLRDRTFFSLNELNQALWEGLDRVNAKPMQKQAGSRDERFAQIDQPHLRALPREPYRYGEWKRAKVHRDYHIEIARHYYSVPYTLIGERVDVRFNQQTVEIFHRHRRIAFHQRSLRKGGHTTLPDHMPKSHQRVGLRPEQLIEKAQKIGPDVGLWVREVMARRRHPEQGYRSAFGVLRLAKQYPDERVNTACARALELHSYSSASVTSMIKKGLERSAPAEADPLPDHGNVRGSDYFH